MIETKTYFKCENCGCEYASNWRASEELFLEITGELNKTWCTECFYKKCLENDIIIRFETLTIIRKLGEKWEVIMDE